MMNKKKLFKIGKKTVNNIEKNMTDEQRGFARGISVGAGVMAAFMIYKGIKRTAQREKKINDTIDSVEVVLQVIAEKVLEKRGDINGKKEKEEE